MTSLMSLTTMSNFKPPAAGKTLLVRNAQLLVTMDAQRREISDGAVFIRGQSQPMTSRQIELRDRYKTLGGGYPTAYSR